MVDQKFVTKNDQRNNAYRKSLVSCDHFNLNVYGNKNQERWLSIEKNPEKLEIRPPKQKFVRGSTQRRSVDLSKLHSNKLRGRSIDAEATTGGQLSRSLDPEVRIVRKDLGKLRRSLSQLEVRIDRSTERLQSRADALIYTSDSTLVNSAIYHRALERRSKSWVLAHN